MAQIYRIFYTQQGFRYSGTALVTSAHFWELLSLWLFSPNCLILRRIITLFEVQLVGSKGDETAVFGGIDRPKEFLGTCFYGLYCVQFLGGGM